MENFIPDFAESWVSRCQLVYATDESWGPSEELLAVYLCVISGQKDLLHFKLMNWILKNIFRLVYPIFQMYYQMYLFPSGIFAVLKEKCKRIHKALQG